MTTPDDLAALEARYTAAIGAAGDLAALDEVRVAALGKKGELSLKMRDLGGMSPEERKVFGPRAQRAERPAHTGNRRKENSP